MLIKKRNPITILVLCILITFTFANAFSAISLLMGWSTPNVTTVRPQWYFLTSALVNIGLTVSLLAILAGKSWGKYGICISLLFQASFFTLATKKSLSLYNILFVVGVLILMGIYLLYDYVKKLESASEQ